VHVFRVPARVFLQELPHRRLPHREGESAGASVLVGEVEAVVIVADVPLAIEIVKAVVVADIADRKAASVVVDDVEHDRDAVNVAQIDQRLDLVRRGKQRARRQRIEALLGENGVDPRR
jgi:hypothetical protein